MPPKAEKGAEREPSRETENAPESPKAAASRSAAEKQPASAPTPAVARAAVAATKDPDLMRVERVLEQNLGDIYIALPPEKRKAFRAKGEETAVSIKKLVDSAKAKARHVLHLIRGWLKLIPHVNRYFLEQDAKIKTDVIMDMVEEKKKSQGL